MPSMKALLLVGTLATAIGVLWLSTISSLWTPIGLGVLVLIVKKYVSLAILTPEQRQERKLSVVLAHGRTEYDRDPRGYFTLVKTRVSHRAAYPAFLIYSEYSKQGRPEISHYKLLRSSNDERIVVVTYGCSARYVNSYTGKTIFAYNGECPRTWPTIITL